MRLPLVLFTAILAGVAGCEDRAATLALDKIPAAVTAAATAALPGFTATSASSEAEDDETEYKLHGTAAGMKATLKIEAKADGTVTVKKSEVEVALDQVPAATRDAALKAAPGLQIAKAEREVKKGVTKWSLEGTAAGKEVEVEVEADGSTEVESGDHEHGDKDEAEGKDHKD